MDYLWTILIGIVSFVVGVFGFCQIVGVIRTRHIRATGTFISVLILWPLIIVLLGVAVHVWFYKYRFVFYVVMVISLLLSWNTGKDGPEEGISGSFNLFPNEVLLNYCKNACDKHIDFYRDNLKSLKGHKDEKIETERLTREYLEKVKDEIFQVCADIGGNYPILLTLVFVSPRRCGYDIDLEQITAGGAYAMVYFVLTDKIAEKESVSMLDNYQAALLEESFHKI